VFILLVVWGIVWGALPLAAQTWMAGASSNGVESGLALFVTTIQLAIAAGSVLGGVAVTQLGLAADFWLAGGVAVIGAIVLITLGFRRSNAVTPVTAVTGSVAVIDSDACLTR
ncbi:MAG: MFS transporter, partial [Lacisediminihabitans sp.]